MTLLAEIQHVQDVRYTLVGDILGQFGSPCNYYHDTEITDSQLSQSGLLKSLSQGNTVKLSQCRRSCKELFDIYKLIPPCAGAIGWLRPLPF